LIRNEKFAGIRSRKQTLYLDGPYGKNQHPERFETVILVAQGIGIAGILPYASYLLDAYKAQKDRGIDPPYSNFLTRRVHIIIKFEDRLQECWATRQLQALQTGDPKKSLVVTRLVSPSDDLERDLDEKLDEKRQDGTPSKHWKHRTLPVKNYDALCLEYIRE
ncbi:hypothetical protein JX265_014121, partial [Neoarthrinium moseri]